MVLTLVFYIPFGIATQSVIEKTEKPLLSTVTTALNRAFWPLFDDLIAILTEFKGK